MCNFSVSRKQFENGQDFFEPKILPEMKDPKQTRRILIIEDNFDSAETLQTLLAMQDHTVEIAFDGKKGIEKALQFAPEIIICDIGLPDSFDGYEVGKAVRNNESLKNTFLIALSGYGQKEDIQKSIESGFDAHLVKPADFDKLFELIEELDNFQE